MPDANTILTYNGIDLQIGRVLDSEMRAVYDDTGVDFLYVHFRIRVQAIFNPRATASQVNNPSGDTPAASLSFLRQRLLTPRQSLQINIGNDTLLVSPQINADANVPFATDANNGPHPIDLQILSVHGSKSIVVAYEIETWLNECTGSSGSPPPTILSHRWEMTEDIGDDYLSTRTIRGRATFRTDFLLAESNVPDDFRRYLFHPVPPFFQRTSIRVTPESDGTALNYEIVDEEQVWNLDPSRGIIRVEGYQTEGWDWIGFLNPSVYFHLHLEVWGQPNATNRNLVDALLQILSTCQNIVGITRKPLFAAEARVDFPARHATLDLRGVAGAIVSTSLFLRGAAPNLDTVTFVESFGALGGPGAFDGRNPLPPGDLGSRTDVLIRLFGQLNNQPCQPPARVANPGTADNVIAS